MKIVYTEVLVIGGGLAGLRVAIAAKRRGHEAIILSLVPQPRFLGRAGRHAGVPGTVIKGQGDNEDVHFEDTRCAAATGVLTRKWCACSSTPRPRRCASWPHGACPGAG